MIVIKDAVLIEKTTESTENDTLNKKSVTFPNIIDNEISHNVTSTNNKSPYNESTASTESVASLESANSLNYDQHATIDDQMAKLFGEEKQHTNESEENKTNKKRKHQSNAPRSSKINRTPRWIDPLDSSRFNDQSIVSFDELKKIIYTNQQIRHELMVEEKKYKMLIARRMNQLRSSLKFGSKKFFCGYVYQSENKEPIVRIMRLTMSEIETLDKIKIKYFGPPTTGSVKKPKSSCRFLSKFPQILSEADGIKQFEWLEKAEKFLLMESGDVTWEMIEKSYPYACYGFKLEELDEIDGVVIQFLTVNQLLQQYEMDLLDGEVWFKELKLRTPDEAVMHCLTPWDMVKARIIEICELTLDVEERKPCVGSRNIVSWTFDIGKH